MQQPNLLQASDEFISAAVDQADPMALRGLVYQLTGDESLADIDLTLVTTGQIDEMLPTDPADLALIRQKAVDFLTSFRDRGGGDVDLGPESRLHRSLNLTAGAVLPDAEVDMWLEQLALNPFARGLDWPAEPTPEQLSDFSVLVIGAGMGGLNAAVHLKRAGIPFTVIEKNSGVGGTWFENRYPGARVDIPSRSYTHVYGVDFEWPGRFCEQEENERYFNWIADHFELRPNIEFDTEVESVVWNEETQIWTLEGSGPSGRRTWRGNAVICAVGFLSRPNVPGLVGADDFEGDIFHSARWPADLDITGKRVAVVGSGCTGYQLTPEVAKAAAHTLVFQRTPSWVFDVKGYCDLFTPEARWLNRNFPYFNNFERFRNSWHFGPDGVSQGFTVDPNWEDEGSTSALNRRIRRQRLEFMTRKLGHQPELMDAMLPAAPPMTSRPVLVDADYSIYDVLLQDEATLVTASIRRITAHGIETEDGIEHPADVIVLATGFKANDFLWPMEVRGRDGLSVEDLWAKDGARAYLSTMLPGFPNLFMIYGPNSNPVGGLVVPDFEEIVTRFALECFAHLILTGQKSVDVTSDAYWRYNHLVDSAEAFKAYADPRVNNYYKNEHGRSAVNCPIDTRKLWRWMRDPTRDGDAASPEDEIRPHFGWDLVTE